MKKYRLLIAISIILILGTILLFILKKPNFYQKPTVNIHANFELTGILRELDLDDDFKTKRFISDGQYQLTQLNTEDVRKLPFNATNLFLEAYPDTTKDLVGKCVTIKGKLDTNWISKIEQNFENNENRYLYKELVFIATNIDKNDFSKCNGYSQKNDIPEGSKATVVVGTIRRTPRLVPDVGPYDYVIVLDEPYTSTENSSGQPQVRDSMPITPNNNDVWTKLEAKVGKKTAIEVYELWGYVESKYLLVTRVMQE